MPSFQGILIGAIAALLLALGLVILWQHLELTHAEAQYNSALSQQAVLAAANNNFQQLADKQNQALAKLNAARAARTAVAQRAIADASQNIKRYDAFARSIANQKTTGDDCQNAQSVLRTYFAGAKMKRALAALLLLAACAPAPQQVFTPQPVDMPVAVGCKAPVPATPPDLMAALPDNATLTQSLQSCLRQTLTDKGFIEQLTAELKACR